MRILMSGGSGLIGTALTRRLRAAGHQVAHLVRPGRPSEPRGVDWDPRAATLDLARMEGTDVVVHLSGASIAERRWTSARKAELRSSRVDTTRVLVDALMNLAHKPRAFLCASAIGYYGDHGDEILTESTACGTDFLALLARDWEAEAMRAAHGGIRSVPLRFGVILAPHGGALPKMLQPIRWGVGGRLGSGQQWLSWIALDDAIEVAHDAIVDERFDGPVNVVSPNPVRNLEFTEIAAAILNRPAIFPAPAFALRVVLGEMAGPLLLASQRVKPQRLLDWGYTFRHANLQKTLLTMVSGKRVS